MRSAIRFRNGSILLRFSKQLKIFFCDKSIFFHYATLLLSIFQTVGLPHCNASSAYTHTKTKSLKPSMSCTNRHWQPDSPFCLFSLSYCISEFTYIPFSALYICSSFNKKNTLNYQKQTISTIIRRVPR